MPIDLTNEIHRELTRYSGEIADKIKAQAEETTKLLVEETKATAPKRQGKYKRAITSRKLKETRGAVIYQWYVKAPHYRLSHLLNNGHALRNGGRYEGTKFITKAEEKAVQEFEDAVERIIADD